MATLQDFGQTKTINRRTAQVQAASQAEKYQTNVAQKQIKAANERLQATQQYFEDNKNVLAAENEKIRLANLANPGGTQIQDILSQGIEGAQNQRARAMEMIPVPNAANAQFLQNVQNVYTNKAAGLDSMATGTPGASVFDQRTVTTTNAGLQKRIETMRKNGMDEAQIAQEIQKGRDTMSAIPESKAVQNKIDAAAESVRKQKENLVQSGVSIDPAAWAQAEQEARRAAAEEASAKAAAQAAEEARKKSYTPTVDPNVNAAKIEMENTKNTITQDLKGSNDYIDQLDSSLSNLSPLLQEAGKSFISYAKGRAADLQKSFESQLAFIPTEEEITAQYAGQEADIRKNKELLLGIADRNKKLQEDIAMYNRDMMLADKAMIEHENNAALFKQAKANTDNERKLRRQLGRLGLNTDLQSLQFLDDAIQEGQTIYDNLRISGDLSLIKANLAIGQGYMLDMTKAINDHDSAVATILANAEQELKTVKNAIGTAKSDRLKTIRDLIGKREENKAELEGKLADKIFELNKEMSNEVNRKRDDERAKEQLGINMLDKLVDTYGNNVPPSLLETVKKYIPNIDVQDVMRRRTLAQMKKGAGGGVGGITGFSLSQRTPTGKPQSLEQFMETKQKEFNAKYAGAASPEMRKEWEKEYNAKLAIDTTNSAEQLMKEWSIKRAGSGNFPNLGTMKAVQADFEAAIRSGDFDFARQILDGIGARPPTAIAEKITTTQQLVADLNGMENLLDEIEQNVGAFPTKGKLWTFINENIETTPEYARLRQYVDTNLTPYARTVSGERGASTEPDVQRAMSSLLDPNVDAPALRAALAQAKKRAAMSSTLLLKNMRDGGYRVNNLQESNDKFMNQYQQQTTSIPQSIQDWFNKYN